MTQDADVMQRVDAAASEAIASPPMRRILMDVTDKVVIDKILDAFIEGAKCGVVALGQELTAKQIAKFKDARNG